MPLAYSLELCQSSLKCSLYLPDLQIDQGPQGETLVCEWLGEMRMESTRTFAKLIPLPTIFGFHFST